MKYFLRSQRVKQEIVSEESLLSRARRAFNSEYEPIGWGSTVDVFRIGTLLSGLYVAMRVFRKDGHFGDSSIETQKSLLEDYCQNAEELDSEGKEVPKFCVGVSCEERAGIFTEDLTAADTQNFEHHRDDDFAWVGERENRRKVYVDIDHLFGPRRYSIETKYFLDEHLITI